MRSFIIVAALLAVLVFCHAQAERKINPGLIEHRLKRREAICTDQCMKMSKNVSKCMAICADIVMNKKATEEVIKKVIAEEETQETAEALSDLSAEEQQAEATKHLWELYHTNLKQLLSNGVYNPGFQLLPNAIDISDIRRYGGDQMPAIALKTMNAEDFDNPRVLGQEIIMTTTQGPFRQTNGIKWVDEYRAFLSGVQGAKDIPDVDPETSVAAEKALKFQEELNKCDEKYLSASPIILQMYNPEQYSNLFCPSVKTTERAMFAAIGAEQARIGNNPAYGAAVALGIAKTLYTDSTAFTKIQSVRLMEWDCIASQNDPDIPYRASPRQFDFNYNFHTWKNTASSSSFSVSVGYGVFNAKVGHSTEKMTGMDLTAIGGVSVGFADLKYIPLYPGSWYVSSAIRDFRYTPRESTSAPMTRFFGSTGGLTLFPKGLYVAVNPNIGFNVKTDRKDTFMKKSQTAIEAGVSIFGINLGGNYARSKAVEEGTETGGSTMITIKSNSCQPQLFAIDNHYNY